MGKLKAYGWFQFVVGNRLEHLFLGIVWRSQKPNSSPTPDDHLLTTKCWHCIFFPVYASDSKSQEFIKVCLCKVFKKLACEKFKKVSLCKV